MAISEIVNYEAGFEVDIVDPLGKSVGVRFKVKSAECDEAKIAIRRMLNKRAAAQAKNRPYTIEEAESDEIERVVACVVDWDWGGQEYRPGEGEPEFNKKNVRDVLQNEGWIFSQVNDFIGDIQNFMRK